MKKRESFATRPYQYQSGYEVRTEKRYRYYPSLVYKYTGRAQKFKA
jgi:hypothetical protein